MGVPLNEAHRIGRRPLDRPLQAGKLGAQAQRAGCETLPQERFTRSPGRPSSETRGGQGAVVRASTQGKTTAHSCLLSVSPLLCSPAILDLPTHPHPHTPVAPSPCLSLSSPIPSFPGMAYLRGPPGSLTTAAVTAAKPEPLLGCGGERRTVNQLRRPEGNWGREGEGGWGGGHWTAGLGAPIRRGRGHQRPRSVWLPALKQCSLKTRAQPFIQALSLLLALTPVA